MFTSFSGQDVGSEWRRLAPTDSGVASTLRRMIFALAREQDNAAADEAALVPYWKACPDAIIGHRAAARALRELADALSMTQRNPTG